MTHTFTILLLLLIGIVATQAHYLPNVQSVHAQSNQAGAPSVKITPENITDITKPVGSVITFGVNLSSAPHINSFEVIIYYTTKVLIANSIDFSQTVLGSNAKVLVYCIDKTGTQQYPCNGQDKYSQIGEIAFAMNLLSGWTDNITQANPKTLFQINFKVNATGLGQIHLYSATLGVVGVVGNVGSPLGSISVLSLFDGYFTNLPCGSGKACQPPTVRVSFAPNPVPKDSLASFNVTVVEPNAGVNILSYVWYWPDGIGEQPQTNSTVPSLTQPMTHEFLSSRYGLYTACVNNGLCLVTLTVSDSRGVSWEVNIPVTIRVLNIILNVGGPEINPQFRVLPGTPVNISALIVNAGNVPENATLTIRLDKVKPLGSHYYSGIAAVGGQRTLNLIWDTTGLAPKAYAITAEIGNTSALVSDKIVHTLNATARPSATSYVILISPVITGGLSLSILQTTGLGILVLVAAVVAVARLFKKPSYLQPL